MNNEDILQELQDVAYENIVGTDAGIDGRKFKQQVDDLYNIYPKRQKLYTETEVLELLKKAFRDAFQIEGWSINEIYDHAEEFFNQHKK